MIVCEKVLEPFIVRLIAALERVYKDEAARLQHAAHSRKTTRRTFGGNSWNKKILVTASWLSSGTGSDFAFPTVRFIRDQRFK